jgi:EmrB/QacA subfamily drug resistance transporter
MDFCVWGLAILHKEGQMTTVALLPMSIKRRRVVTAGVLLGMFLASLEVTIVGTAMPTIIASLGGLKHYSWVFSAYLIASTVPVPVWGKLSDIYGRKRLYQIGIAMFLLGSALSGMATSMTQLIIFRAVQGLGAGVIIPLAMTITGDIYSLHERTRMQPVFSGVWGLSSILGPLVGGFITDQLSWRWVFYINIPFGLAAAFVIGFALKEPKLRERPNIDYAGALTLIIGVTLLMLAMVEDDSGANSLFTARNGALLLAALVSFGIFLGIERRANNPIMPPQLFKNRVVSIGLLASFGAGVGMFGAISFVPFFAQGVLGSSATEAGSLLMPLLLSWVVMGIIGGRLLLRVGFHRMAMFGLSLMTIGFVALATAGRNTSYFHLSLELVVIGAGLGLAILTLLLAAQQSVGRSQLGLVTSLSQFSRSIGGAMGVAVMGAILSSSLAMHLASMAQSGGDLSPALATKLAADPNALIDTAAQKELSMAAVNALRTALGMSLGHVFWMCAAFSALSFVALFWLPKHIGQPEPTSCTTEAGERMLMAEMANIAPEQETSGTYSGVSDTGDSEDDKSNH